MDSVDCRLSKHYHNTAMSYADDALRCRRNGEDKLAKQSFRLALDYERMAADLADDEVSRSVLYRSAAYLALDCDEPAQADELARKGLEGNPSAEIAAELRAALSRAVRRRVENLLCAVREEARAKGASLPDNGGLPIEIGSYTRCPLPDSAIGWCACVVSWCLALAAGLITGAWLWNLFTKQ